MLETLDRELHPLTEWLTPSATQDPAVQDPAVDGAPRVVVRIAGDPDRSAVLLAAVCRLFDARSGAHVLVAVRGALEARQEDAQKLLALLPALAADSTTLPDIELVGDGPDLDRDALVVVDTDGTPHEDAETIAQLVGLVQGHS